MKISTFPILFSGTTEVNEATLDQSAAGSNAPYIPDFFKIEGVNGESVTFDRPVADEKTFEPETDDSEPGEPTEPDPGDAGDAGGEGSLGGGEIILVDLVGSSADGPASEDTRMGIQQSVEPLPDWETGSLIAGDKAIEPEQDDREPGVPTEPDPGDAGDGSAADTLPIEELTVNFTPIRSDTRESGDSYGDGGRETYLVYELENPGVDGFDFKLAGADREPATSVGDDALSLELAHIAETERPGEIPLGWDAGGIESDDHGLDNDGAVIFLTDSVEALL